MILDVNDEAACNSKIKGHGARKGWDVILGRYKRCYCRQSDLDDDD